MNCNLTVILAERKQKKLPHEQKWLAEQIGIRRQSLYKIMNGEDTKLSTALKISKALNKPIHEIWTE